MTDYQSHCAHAHEPVWRVDVDRLGRLVCATCGAPLTPAPTTAPRPVEVAVLFALLVMALLGAGWWFWWMWLG